MRQQIGTPLLSVVLALAFSLHCGAAESPTHGAPPKTLADRIRDLARVSLPGSISYEGTHVDADPFILTDEEQRAVRENHKSMWDAPAPPQLPKDSKEARVTYHVGFMPDTDEQMSQLSARLFRDIFPADATVQHVLIEFFGPVAEQNADRQYGMYQIDRGAFRKIKWNAFNTSNLCSFLRNEAKEAHDSADADEGDQGLSNACGLWPGIETKEVP